MNEVFFKTEEIRMYDFIESLRIFFEGRYTNFTLKNFVIIPLKLTAIVSANLKQNYLVDIYSNQEFIMK